MAAGVYPYFREITGKQGTEVEMGGHKVLMFGSNAYTGLTGDQRVIDAAKKALDQYGSGCAGSRFLNGTLDLHVKLEKELAEFEHKDDALCFSTGFSVNAGVIAMVVGRNDYVICDDRDHASIVDGRRLSFAHQLKYKHNDMDDLEKILQKLPYEAIKLIVVDGVFSMEGDLANLPEIVKLKKKYNCSIMVDEAINYLRCSILRWDDTFIYATREDNDEQVRINYMASNTYVPGDRSYLKRIMVEGEKLNVIRPRIDKDGSLLPELIIYAPDYLINVTSVAGCFDGVGCSPWMDLLRRISPNQPTAPILLGNFAGQLLDETAYKQHTTYADSIRYFFKQNALNIATCNELDASFHVQAQLQKQNILHIMAHDYETMTSNEFRSDEVILEPSFQLRYVRSCGTSR